MFFSKSRTKLDEQLSEFELRTCELQKETMSLRSRLDELLQAHPSTWSIAKTYDLAPTEIKEVLQATLDKVRRGTNKPIRDGHEYELRLSTETVGLISQHVRGKSAEYRQVIAKYYKKSKFPRDRIKNSWDYERFLIRYKFSEVWNDLSDEQKAAVAEKCENEAQRRGVEFKKEILAAGALGAAQLSGFGIYIAASTVLSAATGLIGVALPFAAYTTLSSAISVAIGPAGWAALGALAGLKFFGPRRRETEIAYLTLAAHRVASGAENEGRIILLRQKLAKLEEKRAAIEVEKYDLKAKIRRLKMANVMIKIGITFVALLLSVALIDYFFCDS